MIIFKTYDHRLEVITLNFQSNMLWTSMPTFGTPPQARREFTCTMLGLKIYLFGGIDDSDTAHNDMYILDTGTFTSLSLTK